MAIRFPYSQPDVTAADVDSVAESMQGHFLTQGPKLLEFEEALSKTLGAKHAIVCNSGTAGLHLAYLAVCLGPDRGLLTTPLTFLATASAARMCGAPVAFADTDPVAGNVTAETVRAALKAADVPIAAVTAVHLGGRACDMVDIRQETARSGVALIEDACHAPLASYSDKSGTRFSVGACTHSDAAVFSFHAIKHVAMGEGGAVLTNDDEIARRARICRNHGMIREPENWIQSPEPDAPWYYEMHEVGWNYRACELQCALGVSQLERLDEGIKRRREIAQRYDALLSGLNCLAVPRFDSGHVWHLYPLTIDFAAAGKSRGQVMRELAQRGVGTQVHYIPVNSQPYYRKISNDRTPNADKYYARTLSIPMYNGLSDEDVKTIAGHIRAVLSS
jgi:UDP-4-amino-4,6-dideoxy-N-acetyl-beta-L-altrosamine transaminase